MPKFQGGFDMSRLLKEAQKLQAEMERVEGELAERTVEETAGGGAVKAVVTCGFKVKSIEIDPEAVDLKDLDMLSDLVVAAVNAALDKARKTAQEEMAKVTGGVNLPLV